MFEYEKNAQTTDDIMRCIRDRLKYSSNEHEIGLGDYRVLTTLVERLAKLAKAYEDAVPFLAAHNACGCSIDGPQI